MSQPIIVPLDVPSLEAAQSLVRSLPQVDFWKVGLELFVSTGPAILSFLKDENKRIFLDLKFHDIPNTMAGACASARRYGVDLLTVHASAGKAALQAAREALGDSPTRMIAVTLLTSIPDRTLTQELHVSLALGEYTLKMALLAQEAGLAGAVCSPQEAASLRRVCDPDFLLVCPGVRPTWASKGDQQRVMTPSEAIASGANYLVIGRPITGADDPAAAWAKITAELAHP